MLHKCNLFTRFYVHIHTSKCIVSSKNVEKNVANTIRQPVELLSLSSSSAASSSSYVVKTHNQPVHAMNKSVRVCCFLHRRLVFYQNVHVPNRRQQQNRMQHKTQPQMVTNYFLFNNFQMNYAPIYVCGVVCSMFVCVCLSDECVCVYVLVHFT